MNDEKTATNAPWNSELSRRVSKLTPKGAHQIVARLIEAGSGKPAIMAEFERAMHQLETAPHLRECWTDDAGRGAERAGGQRGAFVSRC